MLRDFVLLSSQLLAILVFNPYSLFVESLFLNYSLSFQFFNELKINIMEFLGF